MDEKNNGIPGAEDGVEETELEEKSEDEQEKGETESKKPEEKDWKKIAEDQRIRAEKAERKLKEHLKDETKSETQPRDNDALSQKDVIALAKADVHDDDIDEVIAFARFKNISVAEALKSPYIVNYRREQDEIRRSQQAAHTSTAKRGNVGPSVDKILADAASGKIPPAGSKEAEMLFYARRGRSVPK